MAITGHHNTYFLVFTSQDMLTHCAKLDQSDWVFRNVFSKVFIGYYTNFYLSDVRKAMLELK